VRARVQRWGAQRREGSPEESEWRDLEIFHVHMRERCTRERGSERKRERENIIIIHYYMSASFQKEEDLGEAESERVRREREMSEERAGRYFIYYWGKSLWEEYYYYSLLLLFILLHIIIRYYWGAEQALLPQRRQRGLRVRAEKAALMILLFWYPCLW